MTHPYKAASYQVMLRRKASWRAKASQYESNGHNSLEASHGVKTSR